MQNLLDLLRNIVEVKLDRKLHDNWRDQQLVVGVNRELRTNLAGFPFPLTSFAHKIVRREGDVYQLALDVTATERLNEPGWWECDDAE